MALSHVLRQSDRLGADGKIEVELSQGGDDNSVTTHVTFIA